MSENTQEQINIAQAETESREPDFRDRWMDLYAKYSEAIKNPNGI